MWLGFIYSTVVKKKSCGVPIVTCTDAREKTHSRRNYNDVKLPVIYFQINYQYTTFPW